MPKKYKIQEIYYTVQGEGFHTGKPAVFCRFVGCNLWSGQEKDRENASCRFCDTRFIGMDGPLGGVYEARDLVDVIVQLWPSTESPFVVFTGGEPTLQLTEDLVQVCKQANCYIAVETNGTKVVPNGVDWICLSPKPRSNIVQYTVSELKLVYPQSEPEMQPEQFLHIQAEHYFLQPLCGNNTSTNTRQTIEYCLQHPKWRLSLQTHKILGLL